MAANTAFKVADLDFFSIKQNLKDFLKTQDVFTDYDFEGSGMSVLLDLLAYNTYYNGFYLNMVANEAFIDTAQMRQNMLSLAKSISYVPKSRQSAMAKVNLRVVPSSGEPTDINSITLERYTKFIGANKDGTNYPFVAINSNTATKSAGVFNFSNVILRQGEVVTLQFAVDANNESRRYQIPSANVDTTTLTIRVQESSTNTYSEVYNEADDLTVIRHDSKIYYVEEDPTLNYTFYFGDDVLGKKPKLGNIIVVNYLESAGAEANNIQRFAITDPIGNTYKSGVVVSTVTPSYGGNDQESVDQIRFRAPHFYTTQNRAVTKNDYEALITREYQDIDAVSIWGGEENDPPVYGKVYMSLKTKGYYNLTNLEKDLIKQNLIAKRNVLTVIPEIVDPNYTFVLMKGSVTYNPTVTSKTAEQLKTLVTTAISRYNNEELNGFKNTFRKSRLQLFVDSCDPAITGSNLKFYIQQRVNLNLNKTEKYIARFNTTIQKGTISDKLYTYPEIEVSDGLKRRLVNIEETPAAFTGIDSVIINNPGYGYLTEPTVTIGGDGSGATARATVVNGRIESIKITNRGSNYTTAYIAIASPTGVEASATPLLQNRFGTLRSYYYNDLGEKIIVNDNAGTIDYAEGVVTLDNLTAYSLKSNPYYDTTTLTINVLPEGDTISPLRNRIISIDENNAQSVTIEVVAEA